MYAGQVVEAGPAARILARPMHPYTRALLACRPHRGKDGAVHFAPIPGAPPRGVFPAGCRFAPRCGIAEQACTLAPILLATIEPGHDTRCRRWNALP